MTKRRARVCSVTKRDHAGATGGQTEFSLCLLLAVRTGCSRRLPTFNVCDSGLVRKALFFSLFSFWFFFLLPTARTAMCGTHWADGGFPHQTQREATQVQPDLRGRTDGRTGSD